MPNVKQLVFVMTLLAIMFSAVACQVVHVKDTKGDAIAFASVKTKVKDKPYSGVSGWTDMMGNMLLASRMAGDKTQEWIIVNKDGYVSRTITRTDAPKIEIVMMKTTEIRSLPKAPTQEKAPAPAPTTQESK